MRLPQQIRVRSNSGRIEFGAGGNSLGSARPTEGIAPQTSDPRCTDPNTRCPTTCGPNGQKTCNLGRAYFSCDC